ncbi:MAG: alpha/beta hydrolase [Planctomycetaceae bacterium]
MKPLRISAIVTVLAMTVSSVVAREPDYVINLWNGSQPGPAIDAGEEQDFTKDTDRLIAGRRIIKLGNVSVPQAHVFLAPEGQRSGAAVAICPGGGYNILAWDLEGTEVAEWLNSVGITAVVVKYRVPTGKLDPKWLGPVQDTQRSISLIRANAQDWGVDTAKVGVLGFSAGGDTAARTALATERHYEPVDQIDDQLCVANAGILIYPAYLTNDERTALKDDLKVSKESPRMFLAHAWDDPVTPASSLLLALALRKHDVAAELHLYDAGGHGYGLRAVDGKPVTSWNLRCADWLHRNGWAR